VQSNEWRPSEDDTPASVDPENHATTNAPWTDAEVEQLIALVEEHGRGEWEAKAALLGTDRTANACIIRYGRYARACGISEGASSTADERQQQQRRRRRPAHGSAKAIATVLRERGDVKSPKDYGFASICPGCSGSKKAHICGKARTRKVVVTLTVAGASHRDPSTPQQLPLAPFAELTVCVTH
jgi:hypothetical protein